MREQDALRHSSAFFFFFFLAHPPCTFAGWLSDQAAGVEQPRVSFLRNFPFPRFLQLRARLQSLEQDLHPFLLEGG